MHAYVAFVNVSPVGLIFLTPPTVLVDCDHSLLTRDFPTLCCVRRRGAWRIFSACCLLYLPTVSLSRTLSVCPVTRVPCALSRSSIVHSRRVFYSVWMHMWVCVCVWMCVDRFIALFNCFTAMRQVNSFFLRLGLFSLIYCVVVVVALLPATWECHKNVKWKMWNVFSVENISTQQSPRRRSFFGHFL